MWDDIYEVSTKAYGQDWRHTYHWTYSGSDPYLSKFWQYENGTYKNFMPVLRWSEMYYIAAEASLNTDSRLSVILTLSGTTGIWISTRWMKTCR